MNIIDIEHLHRDFLVGSETVHALDDVSFSIAPGEFVSIMGTSGSGKSTLLNLLGCLDTPTSGIYRLDGEDVQMMDDDQLASIRNRKIGFAMPERFSVTDIIRKHVGNLETYYLQQNKIPMLKPSLWLLSVHTNPSP